MDTRIKLEKYILNEFQAKDSQTFLYQLHENSYFDKEKFSILLNICDSLAKRMVNLVKLITIMR